MKKIYLIMLGLLFLPGCLQPSALLGSGITVATSGNIYKAGLSYGSNTLIKQHTGKTPTEHVISALENRKNKKQKKKFIKYVDYNISLSREKNFH